MNARMLVAVAVVCSILGVGAMMMLGPSTDTEPATVGEVQGAGASRENPFASPNVDRPLPKRRAAMRGPAERREGVPTSRPDHDFTQHYPATLEALEGGVMARSHRLLACTDVHGMPSVPPNHPVPEHIDLDSHMAVEVMLAMGEADGKVDVQVNGASGELIECFHQAMSDMSIASPGPQAITTQLYVPLDG